MCTWSCPDDGQTRPPMAARLGVGEGGWGTVTLLMSGPERKEQPSCQCTHTWERCFSVKQRSHLLLRKGKRVQKPPGVVSAGVSKVGCLGHCRGQLDAETCTDAGSRGLVTLPGCLCHLVPPTDLPLLPPASACNTPCTWGIWCVQFL